MGWRRFSEESQSGCRLHDQICLWLRRFGARHVLGSRRDWLERLVAPCIVLNGLNIRPHRADGLSELRGPITGSSLGTSSLTAIHERLGETIEASALEPALWPEVLSGLAEAAGADGAALVYQSLADGTGSSVIVGIDPEATPRYFGEYARKNPLQKANTLREQVASFRPVIHHDEHLLPKRDFERTDFYQGIFRPFDMHSVLMVGLGLQGVHRAGINLVRGRRRPQFDEAAFRALSHWHGALIRAFDVGMVLSPLNSARDDLAAALDTLADAVFLVEADGRVTHANEPARRLLAAEQGVAMVGGRLRARDADQVRTLEALIAKAVVDEARTGGSMALIARPGQPPLSLTVTPLGTRRRWAFETQPSAMVRICDFVALRPVAESKLMVLFDLTAAEARVAAAVGGGESPREVAERLGVSFNTVRAQLARVFEKTGIGRQADLARLLARLSVQG